MSDPRPFEHDFDSDNGPLSDMGFDTEFDAPEMAALSGLLGDPAMWPDADPTAPDDQAIEDAIVAAITAEATLDMTTIDEDITGEATLDMAATGEAATAVTQPEGGVNGSVPAADVVSLDQARQRRQRRWPAVAAGALAGAVSVAAAVAVVFFALAAGPFESFDHQLALAGTDLAPDSSATAQIDDTPMGTRIILDVSGLPPAPDGSYYEAWLRQSPEVGVSAGTFHLRGGDAAIELWAGVSIEDYPLLTVTIQDEAQSTSSGQVVLAARLDGQ